MTNTVQDIPLANLAIAFVPVLITLIILQRWSLATGQAIYAIIRMLLQLLLIGYFLTAIFNTNESGIVVLLLAAMVFFSSWIALGTVSKQRYKLYLPALAAIFVGGSFTLLLVTQGTLNLEPWYHPQIMIPLAGMIFASSMNTVSLAAERVQAEIHRGATYTDARNTAFRASMIPIINSLFAVGLVSLPGMMTGQILSGVSPFIAARYQIVVMCILFGASGISAACFLALGRPIILGEKENANKRRD